MVKTDFPAEVRNWINGEECLAVSGQWFDKLSPAEGKPLCRVTRSGAEDIERVVA